MEVNNKFEIDEDKEPTIKLDDLKNITYPPKEEEETTSIDSNEKKYSTDEKFVMSEEKYENKFEMEEVSDNKEISTKELEEKSIIEETSDKKEEQKEELKTVEPVEEVVREKEEKKINMMVISAIIAMVVLVAIILTVVFTTGKNNKTSSNSNKNSSNENSFISLIEASIKEGTLDKDIKKSLNSAGVNTSKVKMMSLDIDSDKKQELIIYAEDDSKKIILQFEVDEDIYYEDSFQVDSAQSIGYAYSLVDKDAYFYTEFNGSYTIIGYTKLVVKEEDFLNKYFPVTKEYKSKPFLDNTIAYNFDKKLDVKSIDKNMINAKSILEDNDTTLIKINEAANKYVSEREEAKRQQEEEEKRRKEEEEAQKKASKTLELNGKNIHYGKYLPNKKGEITKLTINEDGTGTINTVLCSWKEDKKALVTNEEIPVLTFTCDDKTYDLTAMSDDNLSNGTSIDLKYEE